MSSAFQRQSSSTGSALLLLLASLFLLTVLVVGFLSRSTFERQLSAASSGLGKTDLAGQGSIAMVIGDLQQEIVAGSNGSGTPTLASGYFYPTQASTTIPQVTGFTPAVGLENLIKVSRSGAAFYSGSGYTSDGANRASSINTSANPSRNNRSISPLRWNKPMLLAKASTGGTDITPVAGFVAPDWIYVAADGSNPTNWSNSYQFSRNASPTSSSSGGAAGTNPVLQRYAYAIYDEGGTLDINSAGSPAYNNSGVPGYSSYASFKNALAYADLSQLPYLSALSGTQASIFIDALVGWRNYASASNTGGTVSNSIISATGKSSGGITSVTGIFPGTSTPYRFPGTITGSSLSPFDMNVAVNSTGSMGVNGIGLASGTSTQGNPNQTDNAFVSRQQMIQFFMQGLGQNTSFLSSSGLSLANLQNLLPYFGTFSRDVNQPSYAPSPNRPLIVGTAANGGNDYDTADKLINPPFLSILTSSGGWQRNDGSIAIAGEPLVKKRFALNRLTWITYLGPSADRGSSSITSPSSSPGGTDYDLYQLENMNGIPSSFLKLGTDTNIQKYFGLVWKSDHWLYSPVSGSAGSIATLSKIQPLSREPNFFELLKATILAGSIGKDFPSDVSDTQQNQTYTSGDCSIFQIAANIIDQSTCDGYPTQIQFASAGNTYNFYGVKNLPYLYRVRTATLTTTPPIASPTVYPTAAKDQINPFTGTLTTPGTFTVLQEPEIWNPHNWNPVDSNTYGMGSPRPTVFALIANSSTTPTIYPRCEGNNGPNPNPGNLNGSLTFNVNLTSQGAGLFREPTFLLTPNIPAGSSLSGSAGSSVNAYGIPYAYQNKGPAGLNSTNPFLGFVIGTADICWVTGTAPNQILNLANQANISNASSLLVNYQLECNRPGSGSATLPYDTKLGYTVPTNTDYIATKSADFSTSVPSSMVDINTEMPGAYLDEMIPIWNLNGVFDPRTGRFGFQNAGGFQFDYGLSETMFPPRPFTYSSTARWVSSEQNITESDRPDNFAGYGVSTGNANPGGSFPPNNNYGWFWTGGTELFHGLFQVNSMNYSANDASFAFSPFGTRDSASPQYYADPDGVVRRGTSAYVATATSGTPQPSSVTTVGLPMSTSVAYNTIGTATPLTAPYTNTSPANISSGMMSNQTNGGPTINVNTGTIYSRPIILNRPFRTVAELGYVFSGTPWKSLDLQTPESGCTGLLDVFCINDTNDPNELVAGKIDLNTRQVSVLQSVLSGAYVDDYASLTSALSPNLNASGGLSATTSSNVAQSLAAYTAQTPITNLSELVGKFLPSSTPTAPIDGSNSSYFSGFGAKLSNLSDFGAADYYMNNIERFREAPVRALAAASTARVWNLMIDVITQTGRFGASAASLGDFNVEGERRYWVHVAIDRSTGKVVDEQIEEVKE